MSSDKFLAGLIAGGLLGAIAGILFAPSSGKETRDRIVEKSQSTKAKLEESMSDIQSKANNIMDDIQKKGDELLGKVQSVVNCSKKEISEMKEKESTSAY